MDDPRRFLPLTSQQFHILLALTDRDRHGYGLILEIASRTQGTVRLGTGTLYTAVARLVTLGLLADSDRAGSGDHRDDRRRYYRLTALGRLVLKAETTRLEALVRHAHEYGVGTRHWTAALKPRS